MYVSNVADPYTTGQIDKLGGGRLYVCSKVPHFFQAYIVDCRTAFKINDQDQSLFSCDKLPAVPQQLWEEQYKPDDGDTLQKLGSAARFEGFCGWPYGASIFFMQQVASDHDRIVLRCLVPKMMLLMMHQPHLHQPWRLDRCYPSSHAFVHQG